MFLFSLFIAWNIPYTHDDWDWGRQIGITNWLTGTFNNRYIGTFFVIVMTRLPLIKTLVMALTMTFLPLLCAELAADPADPPSGSWLYALASFVTFAMPVITWRQTYGWVAAFSNFTLGALFMLSLLWILRRVHRTGAGSSLLLRVMVFLLALAAQLFSENVSLFLPMILGCSILLTRCQRSRSGFIVFLCALLGTLLGAFLMFYNPLYRNLATTGAAPEQFRTLIFSVDDSIFEILKALLSMLLKQILPSLYETHPVLVLFLSIAVWLDLSPRFRGYTLLLCIPMFFYSIGCFYCAAQMRLASNWVPASETLRMVGAVSFTALMLLSIFCSPRREKWHTLAFFLIGIALITPFAALGDIGPRCYHISHFCLLVAGCSCFNSRTFSVPVKSVLCAALVLTCACLIQVYAAIGSCSIVREELLQEARDSDADTLVLPSVDIRYSYSWGYNPQHPIRAEHYREFYDLPEDITLIFLPYGSAELWPDIPRQMYDEALIYP